MLPVVSGLIIVPGQQVLQNRNRGHAVYWLIREFAVTRCDVAATRVAHLQTPPETSSGDQFNTHERQFLAAHDSGQTTPTYAACEQIRLNL